MRFQAKTDTEIATEGLPPEGWHEAEVIAAEEATSKKGNPMLKVRLKLFTPNGERMAFDYLLGSFARKLKRFCEAAGLEEQYKKGSIEPGDVFGKIVMAEVVHDTPTTGQYANQTNAQINDYRKVERQAKAASVTGKAQIPAGGVEINEDDIPF